MSSAPQAAPSRGNETPQSQTVTGAPPASETFRILSSAQKPTHWPSGEKKGVYAPSVPAIGTAAAPSSDRRKSCLLSARRPTYTTRRPSGEIARVE